MSDIDRIVSDAVTDGKITDEDAATALTFRDFLAAVGPPRNSPQWAALTDAERAAYLKAAKPWHAYMVGDADGPTQPPQEPTR